MSCLTKRITNYSRGERGSFEIIADTVEELNEAVDKLYKEYPKCPYSSYTTGVTKDKNNKFHVYFEHYGAD